MSESIALELSTAVKPPKKFLVDGTEYQLLGLEHLSAETENEVMALFARHAIVAGELETCSSVVKGAEMAGRMKRIQTILIGKLTTLPDDVIKILPMSASAKIFEQVQMDIVAEDDDLEEQPTATADSQAPSDESSPL
jgi:hypothetical protein